MDKILEWFGEEEYSNRLDRIYGFWAGNERFITTVHATEGHYRQVFEEDEIKRLAPANLKAQAKMPGLNMPTFFADFGTISTAKYWGGTPRFDSTGGNIFLDPVAADTEKALSIEPLPVEDSNQDAALAIRLFRALSDELQTKSLWLRIPDLQGPLNTAGMVVNQENFLVDMFTEPDNVKQLLNTVTEFEIRYARYFHENTDGRTCGYIWPYTFFPCDVGLALTEDMMPLISPEHYLEFGIPCLRRLADEFGSLQIHCCGEWGRHAKNLAESGINIKAVEFHYPFTTIEQLEPLAPDTVFIPYITLDKQDKFAGIVEYYEYLLAETGNDHRYWFAFYEDTEEARNFAVKHGF